MRRFISINVYGHPTGFTFDPAEVTRKVQQAFPGASVDPRDQLALRAQNARQAWPEPTAPMRTVLEAMQRDAKTQGPAYSFTIPCGGPEEIKGVAKRHLVQIGYGEPLDERCLERLRAFLRSLVVGLHDVTLQES